MISVSIRCYAELNNFLPLECRYTDFLFQLPENALVEMLLEKLKIPSQAIDLVLINGTPVNLISHVNENDRIALYPVFETFNITSVTKLRDKPLRKTRFVLDVHLGKLAHHLRMFGFDTLYKNDYTDDVLFKISLEENRTLLSRSKSLIENEALLHAYLIKSKEPRRQLIEVFERFDLYSSTIPFTRCIECNSLLHSVDKEDILPSIPASVRNWCDEYQRCGFCNRLYWKGSHFKNMNIFVQDIMNRRTSIDESTDDNG